MKRVEQRATKDAGTQSLQWIVVGLAARPPRERATEGGGNTLLLYGSHGVVNPMLKMVGAFEESVKKYPLIPMGTPDLYTPPKQ